MNLEPFPMQKDHASCLTLAPMCPFLVALIVVCLNVNGRTEAAETKKGPRERTLAGLQQSDQALALLIRCRKPNRHRCEEGYWHEVAASADGKAAFVPIFGNAGVGKPGTDGQLIRVIDLAKHQITGTIDFGKGVRRTARSSVR